MAVTEESRDRCGSGAGSRGTKTDDKKTGTFLDEESQARTARHNKDRKESEREMQAIALELKIAKEP